MDGPGHPAAAAHPKNSAFKVISCDAEAEYSKPLEVGKPVKGLVMGYFGPKGSKKPTHIVIVNEDYTKPVKATIEGPGKLEIYIPSSRTWYPGSGNTASFDMQPGGGGW